MSQNIFPMHKVLYSPVGPGVVTEETEAGYLKVNHIAVGWLIAESIETGDFILFDPNNHVRNGKIQVYLKTGFNPLTDIPVDYKSIIVGSAEIYNKMKSDIPTLGFIKEVLL